MGCWVKPEMVGEEDTGPTEFSGGGREGRGAADTLVALSPPGESLPGLQRSEGRAPPQHTHTHTPTVLRKVLTGSVNLSPASKALLRNSVPCAEFFWVQYQVPC